MEQGISRATRVDFDPYEADFERSGSSSSDTRPSTSDSHHRGFNLPLQLANLVQSASSPLSLSRSPPSTNAFAPGAHRRSHPNLQHLSLAPLTPKYPINPSDYEAYFDPETSELHTSTSLSHIAGLPSPGGILTNSPTRSRANSRTRSLKRKAKSTVAFKTLDGHARLESHRELPHGALTSQGFGGNVASNKNNSASTLRLKINTKDSDSSWLVQTGLALTEGSRESKGQSWLVKRASSTSLHAAVAEDYQQKVAFSDRPFRSPYASGRNTPNRSRRNSKDRRRSKRDLAMTPSVTHITESVGQETEAGTDDPMQSRLIVTDSHGQGYSGPDWVDSQTQAEIAAELENEMAHELEPAALYSDDDQDSEWWRQDRYGMVDFEGHWDEDEREKEAEAEVQKAVKERGFGVGRWVDGLVDVFLKIDEDEEERDLEVGLPSRDDDVATQEADKAAPSRRAEGEPNKTGGAEGSGHTSSSDDSIEAAPENPKSVWEDVAWFGRLVLRTARS